ncbi:MFS general substrate transporter [Mycena leptocephala]|nr:MFS general substrate transporter [Mycena leptocephala]
MSGPEPEATIPQGEPEFMPATFPEGGFQAWATVAGAYSVSAPEIKRNDSVLFSDFYTRDYLTESSASAISRPGRRPLLRKRTLVRFIAVGNGTSLNPSQLPPCLRGGSPAVLQPVHALTLQTATILPSLLVFYPTWRLLKLYSLQIFLAQGLGAGLGSGAMYVPSIAVISHYFQKPRALAMAIVASGSSLGAVVHPIMLNNTLKTLGFGNAVRASGSLVSGLLIIACLLKRPRLPPSQTHLPFWNIATYAVGVFFPIFYLQLDAVKHGINKTLSFYSRELRGTARPGVLRLGILNLIMGSMGCGAVFILSMIALRTIVSVVIIGVLYGLCIGVYITLIPPFLAILTEHIGELGLRMGVTFVLIGIGGLIGAPINGALLAGNFLMASVGFSGFLVTFVDVRRQIAKHTLTDEPAMKRTGAIDNCIEGEKEAGKEKI